MEIHNYAETVFFEGFKKGKRVTLLKYERMRHYSQNCFCFFKKASSRY